jgi:hypothetical protein
LFVWFFFPSHCFLPSHHYYLLSHYWFLPSYLELELLQNQTINIVKGTLSKVLNIQLHYLDGNNLHVTLLEILLFPIHPCATTCNQMSHAFTNGCLCNYFSKFDEVWSSFQLGCDYDVFHP